MQVERHLFRKTINLKDTLVIASQIEKGVCIGSADIHINIRCIGSADSQIEKGVYLDLQTSRLKYWCIGYVDCQIDVRYVGYADCQIFLSSSGLQKLLINVQGAICTKLTCSCCGINMLC